MNATTTPLSAKAPMTPVEIGFLIRVYREAMDWSQETLAELSGLTVRTIQRVEAGQSSSLDTRRAIARGFQIPDLDAFSKPMPFPTAEEVQERRAAFDREHIVVDAEVVDGRKVIAMLLDGTGYAAISAGSTAELPRAAQDAFAPILDYTRDCMDVADVASRTDMLAFSDGLDELIAELLKPGYGLCAARRSTSMTNKSWVDPTPIPFDITYLVAAPSDAPPSKFALPRKLGQPAF